jgi:subtilisin
MRIIITVFIAAFLLISAPASFAEDPLLDIIVVLKDPPEPGRYLVNKASAENVARGLGLTAKLSFGNVLYGFAASVPRNALSALQNDPRVDYINFDQPVSINAAPDNALAKRPGGGGGSSAQVTPWGIAAIQASQSNSNQGQGVDVYVIDTGIDSNHSDLATLGSSTAIVTCSGASTTCRTPWDDDNGHGTHVSGTIAALNNSIDVVGVAPRATLHAVKVLNKTGSGTWSGVIAGIDWVATNKPLGSAVIANMSLGGSGSKGTGTCTSSGYTKGSGSADAMYASLCNAANQGVLFSVAAGNSGANAANSVPAAYYDAVITVSAMGKNSQALYDWPNWSNWGIINDAGSGITTPTAPVSITAPGVSILSLKYNGGTTTLSGTSMAAPHVTGALALFVKKQTLLGTMSNYYAALVQARTELLSNSDPACPSSCSSGWANSSGHPHAENFLDVTNLY